MRLTLAQKILAGFAACTAILVTVAVFSFKNSEKYIDSTEWVNHTHQVLIEFDQILINTVDAETGARGYVITGDPTYLEPYRTAEANVQEHLQNVKELTKDNPRQQQNIERLSTRIDLRVEALKKCVTLRQENFEAAQKFISSGEGKMLQDEIRKTITEASDLEYGLLAERDKTSKADINNFNSLFIFLLVVIALVLISVYVIIISNLRALKKAEDETAQKNWVLSGSGDLVKDMQGNKNVKELAQVVVNHLAKYLDAQVAAVYITDEARDRLVLSGGFAMNMQHHEHPGFSFGQGLAGQAAAQSKTIIVSDVSKELFTVNNSFGTIRPKTIIAVPFSTDKTVVGVVELGSVKHFTEIQQQYMEQVADSIAIAITSAQSREKTKELLEETQRQAEELEAQQEELKQSNEELQQKTELLEESEAELKAQQEELQQTNEELEDKANMLEEQKEKLENAKTEIENKAREVEVTSKYKSEFLANMSHELRTPLNSILILSQLLAENKTNSIGDKEMEFARNIYNSGNDLLDLINEILDLSKIESGKMELEITNVPFREITQDMSAMFTEVARNKSVDFKISLDEKMAATILTDKQRVEQIIKNLLSNAFKFTPKGGLVTFTIDKLPSKELFKNRNLATAPNVVAFSVSDTGIGIPANKRAVIFEAFQQADGSTKRKYGGTGLGLSISRELANALGGEIHLESVENQGSKFTLYLPLEFDSTFSTSDDKLIEIKDDQPAPTAAAAEPQPKVQKMQAHASAANVIDDRNSARAGDRIVLIIEDDEIFARVLLDYVRKRNYKGIIASQGNTGISYARYYKPDAILLDITLPVMDGVEVLRQIKNDPELRHIPVQMISGADKKKQGMEMGAFDFLQKPVSTAELQTAFDKVEKFISKKLKKLLIVEDNETQNNAIKELIGNGDVQCFAAYTGKEAYDMLAGDEFDCIIIDLGLPDMTGLELLEKIKANTTMNSIPVVVYTGKELSKEENMQLSRLANTVVLKTVKSHERLLDETILFLHKVESKLPKEKQSMLRKLHKTDEVLRNKKILLADDDIRNIYSLSNALEEEGVQCIIAENGKAALDVLHNNSDIDLILMDVMMPEMDGYEATIEVRKMPQYSKIPIIALTAKAMKGDREKCLEVGMSDYIAKPVNVTQLLSLMRVWLYK